jgi:hypothetical protein
MCHVPRATCNVRRATCLVVVLLLAAGAAAQQGEGQARVERPIVTTGPGPQRLAIDVGLLARGKRFTDVRRTASGGGRAEGGLADLRIYDAQGRELPYLLLHTAREHQWAATITLPVAATKKTSGFEADLGEARTVDAVLIEGLPAPFLKRVVLEGSGDRERWTLLEGEGTVFDLPQERLQQLTLPFAAGVYRYLRVTWDDTNSGRLPMPQQVSARVVPDDSLPHVPLIASVTIQRRPSEPGRSRYRLRLPGAGMPIAALRLDVGPGHVFRAASVSEARLEGAHASPTVLGRDTLVRIERDGATAAALRIRIAPPREAELELAIDDGSNPPLDLRGVSIELAELPWIYFEAPEGPLTARYGNPSESAPAYDLEAVRGAVRLPTVPEARWGEPVEAVATPPAQSSLMPDRGAAIDPSAFRHRRSIAAESAGLAVLPLDVAVLAASKGPALGFADVRIADAAGRQVPYLLERRDEPVTVPLTLRPAATSIPALQSAPGHNRSVYAATLPYGSLPAPRLVLETSDRVFERDVKVIVERRPDRAHRDAWSEVLASARWQHASPDVPAPAVLLPLPEHDATELLIVVDEGDNRPLAISRAEMLLPSWRLRFFSQSGESLTLLYGHDALAPPRYDLALLAPYVMGAEAHDVEAAAAAAATTSVPPAIVSPRLFWLGLGLAVLVLLAIIAKLVAGSSAAPSPRSPPAP